MVQIEVQMFASEVAVHRSGEKRIDGNASDAQFFARDSDGGHVFGGLWKRDVVAIDGATEPKGVDVIVGNHDGIAGAQLFLGDKPSENLAGKEVSGNAQIGLHALEHSNHRLDIEAVPGEARAGMVS